jgi:DNA polymerase elongation subunit (family B)
MDFYTNVFQYGNSIYVRGFDKGMPVNKKVPYAPYVFLENNQPSEYKTLDGKNVFKYDFDCLNDAREFVNNNKTVANRKVYGLTQFAYLYIFDNFKGEINYDPRMIRVGTLDIECAADEGFPDIQKADKPITAITIRFRGKSFVFGCGDFHTNDEKIYYFKCRDEVELILEFIKCWRALEFDVVTGWNIEFFDIPYLVNRIKSVTSEALAKKLSPWGILHEKKVEFKGKENQSYSPVGISVLDYYQLYRKFTFGNQESYKLDYIAQIELGEKKIDYSEYGSLLELYKNNYQKFIEYNIYDCVLVDRLDDKLKFLEQVFALAYDAKVNYNDTMTTVRPWDIIIHNYLLEKNVVIPPMENHVINETLVGGYVKEPQIGLSKWVVSFDLNSLYPHLIMQYNISTETFCDRMHPSDWHSIDALLNGEFDGGDVKYSYAANGCYYRKDKQGFLPELMEKMYNDRTKYKKLMIEAKQRFEKSKSFEDEKLVARYHNMQMAKKIQLNSAYGALGNQYFRWFNFNHAEAITTSGQLSIRWVERKMNAFMNKVLKTNDMDYVIASDTDSIYVTMEKMVNQINAKDELVIVQAINQFCENIIQPKLDQWYQELADMMNAYQQKMQMKRETIANKGIWRGKKMYILNAWNVEGVQYEKPKLKLQGIEAVRSSTPHACRESIKKALEIIMNKDIDALRDYVSDFRDKFDALPFEDVAFPRGMNGITKYYDNNDVYKKATPIHVRGALIFNHMLKKKGITTIPPISDGDKIKFAYLRMPNPVFENVISCPDELPIEFDLDKYIDRDMQFEKSFLEPIKSIANVIGWDIEERPSLEGLLT